MQRGVSIETLITAPSFRRLPSCFAFLVRKDNEGVRRRTSIGISVVKTNPWRLQDTNQLVIPQEGLQGYGAGLRSWCLIALPWSVGS